MGIFKWITKENKFFPRLIKLAEGGFSVTSRGELHQASWSDVTKIVAAKRDLVTIDQICWDIHTNGGVIFVDEDMAGYEKLRDACPSALSGFQEDWFDFVAYAPVESSEKVIFERAA